MGIPSRRWNRSKSIQLKSWRSDAYTVSKLDRYINVKLENLRVEPLPWRVSTQLVRNCLLVVYFLVRRWELRSHLRRRTSTGPHNGDGTSNLYRAVCNRNRVHALRFVLPVSRRSHQQEQNQIRAVVWRTHNAAVAGVRRTSAMPKREMEPLNGMLGLRTNSRSRRFPWRDQS